MSSNSIVNTSADRSSSWRVMQRGGGCPWWSHHFTTGASVCRDAKEVSRRTQKRFRSESPGRKLPEMADPKRITHSTFVPPASRARCTNSMALSSGIMLRPHFYQLLLAPPPPELPPPKPPKPPPPPPHPPPPKPPPPHPPRLRPPKPPPNSSHQNTTFLKGVKRTIRMMITTTIHEKGEACGSASRGAEAGGASTLSWI